jgi:arginine metabolism regulation protein II
MNDFWIHLDGCNKLHSIMRPDQRERDRSPRTKQLLTICGFMNTLSRSTDPYLSPKRWKDGASSTSVDPSTSSSSSSSFCTDDQSLEYTYGISATLARYMDLTILRSQNLDYYTEQDLPPPASLLLAIAAIHDGLTTWSINNEPLASVNEDDHETRSLVTCHILAFHAALVIYFYARTNWPDCTWRDKSSPHTTVTSDNVMRHYNRICVTSLLAAEALKSSCGSRVGWNAMAPIVWPGFIAACEAEPDQQPLWRTWWTGVQWYSIGSIESLWDVVQEVWRQHRHGKIQERPRWLGVLKRSGRRVMSGG